MRPRTRCYVSHGHADHAREHATVITSVNNAKICALRFARRAERKRQQSLFERTPRRAPAIFEYDQTRRLVGRRRSPPHAVQRRTRARQRTIVDRRRARGIRLYRRLQTRTLVHGRGARSETLRRRLMECTFGRPKYVFPPRAEIAGAMIAFAREALEIETVPVFFAYSLGKAQEALAILGSGGIPITVHATIAAIADIYVDAGVDSPWMRSTIPICTTASRHRAWPPGARCRNSPKSGSCKRRCSRAGRSTGIWHFTTERSADSRSRITPTIPRCCATSSWRNRKKCCSSRLARFRAPLTGDGRRRRISRGEYPATVVLGTSPMPTELHPDRRGHSRCESDRRYLRQRRREDARRQQQDARVTHEIVAKRFDPLRAEIARRQCSFPAVRPIRNDRRAGRRSRSSRRDCAPPGRAFARRAPLAI